MFEKIKCDFIVGISQFLVTASCFLFAGGMADKFLSSEYLGGNHRSFIAFVLITLFGPTCCCCFCTYKIIRKFLKKERNPPIAPQIPYGTVVDITEPNNASSSAIEIQVGRPLTGPTRPPRAAPKRQRRNRPIFEPIMV